MKTLKALIAKIIDTPSRHKLSQERLFWAEEKADLTHERNRDMNYQRHLYEASEAEWREQMTELVNRHCDERRQWAREKRELIALEQRARTAMDNTQALMTPHLSGKTRVSSVGNVRMQIDVPEGDASDPLDLLAGFAWLLVDAGYADTEEEWALKLSGLMSRVPPMNPVPAKLVALTPTPTSPKHSLVGVASGQRREARQAAVLGSVSQDYKDTGYELVATMLDNSYQTLGVVIGSDYESQEEMNAAMQSIQAVHALRLEGQTLRLTWEPLSDD